MATNWEWLKSLDEKQTCMMLAYFADHQQHCSGEYASECIGCPIAVDGCCGFPEDDCYTSVKRWMKKEHNPDTFKVLEEGLYDYCS